MISLLKEDGWMGDDEDLDEYEDFSRRAEVWLGQLAKEKYNINRYNPGTSTSVHLISNSS